LSKALQLADWLHDKDTDPKAVTIVRALAEIDSGIHRPKSAREIAEEHAARNTYLERKLAELQKMVRAGRKAAVAA
jgi:hypothetical protein